MLEKMMSGTQRVVVIIIATLGLVGAALMVVSFDRSAVRISPIQEGKVQPERLRMNGAYPIPPTVISSDGKDHQELEDAAIDAGLLNVRALRYWSLCSAELRAVALVDWAYADAIYAFPHNRPLNEAGADGVATPADVAKAKYLRRQSALYGIAARLADRANIPCVKQGQAFDVLNYVAMVVPNQSGGRVTLNVPDYALTGQLLVEYLAFRGECMSVLMSRLESAKARPVDAVPAVYPQDTFTERERARIIAIRSAEVELLRASNIPCK